MLGFMFAFLCLGKAAVCVVLGHDVSVYLVLVGDTQYMALM